MTDATDGGGPLHREISGFDRDSEELVWSAAVGEDVVALLALLLDNGPDLDLVESYELAGAALDAAAAAAGFTPRPGVDYFLETHA
ncbi:hypothetical protein CLV63_101117 [Murinocardiopsis flavida]|uniref:Uncharacterized protein n=1 Tax=Murinocardiopsis flavida TaxID=645275 RepID=A0A2P8DTW5_9ACTN|nr:hypothetical protein [Murinocardiopsis flavida]PSL00643.1 hypothetical protein CLV63_101117 [Murinocardiopsis flavida]